MDTLFPPEVLPSDVPAIQGLQYIPNYITPAVEKRLVEIIDKQPWEMYGSRRIQPYGGSYRRDRNLQEQKALPRWGQVLADKMFADELSAEPFDHMLINEYLPGQGIGSHRDYEPFETVTSLSLLSPYVMEFRDTQSKKRAELLLEPRSLLVMVGDARYRWEHAIAKRKTDVWHGICLERGRRISVTFRSLPSH